MKQALALGTGGTRFQFRSRHPLAKPSFLTRKAGATVPALSPAIAATKVTGDNSGKSARQAGQFAKPKEMVLLRVAILTVYSLGKKTVPGAWENGFSGPWPVSSDNQVICFPPIAGQLGKVSFFISFFNIFYF